MEYKNRTKELREKMHTEILDMLLDPLITLEEIAHRSGTTLSTVFKHAKEAGLRRKDVKPVAADIAQGVEQK
jgi:hypothetical protein